MVIRGVKRYSTYTGFGSTFRYSGFEKSEKIQNILVMDASRYARYQFQSKVMQRDLNKAYTVFKLCGGKISTGHWGCGVFCGEKTLKFLQQLCAAATSGATLDYSTFSDEECSAKFRQLLEHCINNNTTVGQIFQLLQKYGERKDKNMNDPLSLHDYMMENISYLNSQTHTKITKNNENWHFLTFASAAIVFSGALVFFARKRMW